MFPIERLSNSWSKSPLDHIFHLNDTTTNCSSVHINSSEMINFYWQHMNGCDCTHINKKDVTKINDDIYKDVCTKNQLENGCKTIHKSNLINSHIWKKVKLCYKTTPNVNYFTFNKVKVNEMCPDDYPIKCGKFDTLNNTMCIKSNEKCPINYLGFISRFNEIILKPDFLNTNNDYGTIYSDIAILDGYPCINFKEVEKNEINQYILTFDKKRSKCISHIITYNKEKIYHDTRFTLIDEYPKTQFYDENEILKYIYHLPNYPIIRNKDIKFYAGVYIGWDSSCGVGNMLDSINEINNFIKKSVFTRKAIILIIILICLTYIGGISLFKYNKITELVSVSQENSHNLVFVYTILFVLNLILAFFIRNLIKFCNESKINHFMQLVRYNSCSDETTNYLLHDFALKYFLFIDKMLFIKYLCYASVIPSILMILYITNGSRFKFRQLDKKSN